MGRTKFWQEQRAGRLQISRLGRNVRVSGRQAALYLLVAQREGERQVIYASGRAA